MQLMTAGHGAASNQRTETEGKVFLILEFWVLKMANLKLTSFLEKARIQNLKDTITYTDHLKNV